MTFRRPEPDPAVEHRRRPRARVRRALLAAVAALAVVGALLVWDVVAGRRTTAHVATKTVRVVSAERQGDEVHVRARLDAPSPSGTSHELDGVVPASTWALTKVLWACYPPSDPGKGELRTPLDPDCVNFIRKND